MRYRLEQKYNKFIDNLQKGVNRIDSINGQNSDFIKLQIEFQKNLNSYIEESKRNAHEALHATVWDRLVIAFFGETNAGKSTIIETFRILFGEESRREEMKRTKENVDGKIVGDGQSDFTKTYNEYNLSINGRPFTLIDVPGIEGNEDDYKEEISKALNKAHCIFYVQGHNKQPDEKTVEKIKKYLSEWVNVYSIYNVRGDCSFYDEDEERESLMTDKVVKVESLIVNVFQKALGSLYKGNISLQGLLALCSQASFAPSRMDLQKTQRKLVNYFGSKKDIYKFSRFEKITELVDDKSKNFLNEITEANKQKMIGLCRKVYHGIKKNIEQQEKNIVKLKDLLSQFKQDFSLIIGSTKSSIENDIYHINTYLFNNFKDDICNIIDQKELSNDERKRRMEHAQDRLSSAFPLKIQNAIESNLKLMNTKIQNKRKSLDAFKNINLKAGSSYINISGIGMDNVLEEMEISFGDVKGFLAAVGSGALVGSSFTWLFPGLATVIGGVIGGGVHLLRKAVFGDGGRGKAKEEARKQIDDAKNKNRSHLYINVISPFKQKLDKKKFEINETINTEKNNITTIENLLEIVQNNIKSFANELKNKEYGKL